MTDYEIGGRFVSLDANSQLRVLVTGSRKWRRDDIVRRALTECSESAFQLHGELVVVHGGARGADEYADVWAMGAHERGWPVALPERHRADWIGPCREGCPPNHRRPDPRGWDVCPKAGFYRNGDMVDLGAALCLAFIKDNSNGASDCVNKAVKAGIDVVKFEL